MQPGTIGMPYPGPVPPAASATGPTWLVYGIDGPVCELDGQAAGDVTIVSTPAAFRRNLADLAPRLVVIASPPAGPEELLAAVAERRRRNGIRLVLVNNPADIQGRLHALQLGFDEALPASVGVDELQGRARILLDRRRGRKDGSQVLQITDEVDLDPVAHRVRHGGVDVHVRPKEYAILATLAAHPGRVFTRRELIDRVWGSTHRGDARTIDVHVRWLRSKIEADPARPAHLVTVRGVGYRLDPPEL